MTELRDSSPVLCSRDKGTESASLGPSLVMTREGSVSFGALSLSSSSSLSSIAFSLCIHPHENLDDASFPPSSSPFFSSSTASTEDEHRCSEVIGAFPGASKESMVGSAFKIESEARGGDVEAGTSVVGLGRP